MFKYGVVVGGGVFVFVAGFVWSVVEGVACVVCVGCLGDELCASHV